MSRTCFSEDNKPKGFEKFFKNKENKEASSKPEEEKKDSKDEKQQDLTEEEESGSEEKSNHKESGDNRNAVSKFFFDPEMNPKPEGWLAVVMGAAAAYYLFNYKKPM